MAIITISRGSYYRGREVAEKLAAKLGYECISREILLEASQVPLYVYASQFAQRVGLFEHSTVESPGDRGADAVLNPERLQVIAEPRM
jgi:hypothetical protein